MSNNQQSTALALTLAPKNLAEAIELADRLSKATLLPKHFIGKPADVMMAMMTGQEVGLGPMASLRGLFVLDGKVGMYADTMVAIALSRGVAKYFRRVAESDTSVTYETMRAGDDTPQRCTWTMDMAKRAGLGTKDNFRLFPRQMLASRAKAELARDVYPDLLAGLHTPDEVDDTGRARPNAETPIPRHTDAIDADILPADASALLQAVDDAPSIDELKALGPQLRALTNGTLAEAKRRYVAREEALKATVEVVA